MAAPAATDPYSAVYADACTGEESRAPLVLFERRDEEFDGFGEREERCGRMEALDQPGDADLA